MKFFWKKILSFVPALIAPITAGVVINYFFNLYNLFNFIGFLVVYVVIFCISMWLFGMNQYEKDLFVRPLKRLIGRLLNKK
jgi:hypothetical protein